MTQHQRKHIILINGRSFSSHDASSLSLSLPTPSVHRILSHDLVLVPVPHTVRPLPGRGESRAQSRPDLSSPAPSGEEDPSATSDAHPSCIVSRRDRIRRDNTDRASCGYVSSSNAVRADRSPFRNADRAEDGSPGRCGETSIPRRWDTTGCGCRRYIQASYVCRG